MRSCPTGAPRGAPRRLPLLSRRRGASFFSSVSPRGCPRALPFSSVVPSSILTAFVFPFFPRFFFPLLSPLSPLSPFSSFPVFQFSRFPVFPLSRFPAFPLQIRSVFAGKNNGAEPYFRLRPAEVMSFFSFVVPLFTPHAQNRRRQGGGCRTHDFYRASGSSFDSAGAPSQVPLSAAANTGSSSAADVSSV